MLITLYIMIVLLFCVLFYYSKIIDTCNSIFSIVRSSVKIITNRGLSDDEKEVAIQSAAIKMSKNFFLLTIKFLIVFFGAIVPVLVADRMGWVKDKDIVDFSLRVDVLAITTLVLIVGVFFVRKVARFDG